MKKCKCNEEDCQVCDERRLDKMFKEGNAKVSQILNEVDKIEVNMEQNDVREMSTDVLTKIFMESAWGTTKYHLVLEELGRRKKMGEI